MATVSIGEGLALEAWQMEAWQMEAWRFTKLVGLQFCWTKPKYTVQFLYYLIKLWVGLPITSKIVRKSKWKVTHYKCGLIGNTHTSRVFPSIRTL